MGFNGDARILFHLFFFLLSPLFCSRMRKKCAKCCSDTQCCGQDPHFLFHFFSLLHFIQSTKSVLNDFVCAIHSSLFPFHERHNFLFYFHSFEFSHWIHLPEHCKLYHSPSVAKWCRYFSFTFSNYDHIS